jgi:hypothetical protein
MRTLLRELTATRGRMHALVRALQEFFGLQVREGWTERDPTLACACVFGYLLMGGRGGVTRAWAGSGGCVVACVGRDVAAGNELERIPNRAQPCPGPQRLTARP